MRMFLIGMCDIFLILYLTAITVSDPQALLTVDDFIELQSMHETLLEDKQSAEEKIKDMESSLSLSDAQRERIAQDLLEKEQMLAQREQLLASLNEEIQEKEKARQELVSTFKQELEVKKSEIEANREMAEKLQEKARQAEVLAGQMKEEAALAYRTADTAKKVQAKALIIKEEALKDKQEALRRAEEALAARKKAEQEAENAVKAKKVAEEKKQVAEKKAQKLASTIKEITQEGEVAYQDNIQAKLQTLNVSWQSTRVSSTSKYERELILIPFTINDQTFVVFPSKQISFTGRSDKAPDKLKIVYQGKRITSGFIQKDANLIAIALPGITEKAINPYPINTSVDKFMPALLSLRNNGNRSITDTIRKISDTYFIVNRDYLKTNKDKNLEYTVRGFRGTGTHAEEVVRGDQLVDLTGRFIGVANKDNQIIRLDSLSGWDEVRF